jgi:hypothetical protein
MMFSIALLPKLLIAGGSSFLGTLQVPAPSVINNHTLVGEKIPSNQVVCRDRWGTPMPPDTRAGYSLIAPVKGSLIAQSLWVPPIHGERPSRQVLPVKATVTTAPAKAAAASVD